VRQLLKLDYTNLPRTHDTDGDMAKFVLDWRLNLTLDADVPAPMSQAQLIYLASLHKKKNPSVFKPTVPKTITLFEIHPHLRGESVFETKEE
jgi:hypothetical protein